MVKDNSKLEIPSFIFEQQHLEVVHKHRLANNGTSISANQNIINKCESQNVHKRKLGGSHIEYNIFKL